MYKEWDVWVYVCISYRLEVKRFWQFVIIQTLFYEMEMDLTHACSHIFLYGLAFWKSFISRPSIR